MNSGQSERFRLVVSDGGHHQQSMLATQLNSLINDGSLEKFSVLQLNEYIVNSVQQKKVLIILQLGIVSNPGHQLGIPVPIDHNGTQQPPASAQPTVVPLGPHQGYNMGQQQQAVPPPQAMKPDAAR